MTRTVFTPNKAAIHVGVSRSAIMRALASKSLKANRDNRNHWQIELSDLEQWAADRPMSASSDRTMTADMSGHDRDQIKQIAKLEAENSYLRELLSEIREDRDEWRRLASKSWTGIFERIFGRR